MLASKPNADSLSLFGRSLVSSSGPRWIEPALKSLHVWGRSVACLGAARSPDSRTKLVFLGLTVAIGLWLVAVGSTTITIFPPDPFYFARVVHPLFWLGIVILAWTAMSALRLPTSRARTVVDVGIVLVVASYVHGTAAILYSSPSVHDAFAFSRWITLLNSTGHIGSGETWYLDSYPLTAVWLSCCSQMSGISGFAIARYYPLVVPFVTALFLYAICRRFTKANALVAPLAFFACNWAPVWHMSPQGHALLLALGIFYVVSSLGTRHHAKEGFAERVVLLVFTLAMVVSHPTTPLITQAAMMGACVFYVLWNRLSSAQLRDESVAAAPALRVLVGWLGILIVVYSAHVVLEAGFVADRMVSWGQQMLANFLRGDTIVLEDRIVTTPAASYVMGASIRLALTFCTIIAGCAASAGTLWGHGTRGASLTLSGLAFGCWGFSAALVVAGFNEYGFDRGFAFGVVPVSLLFALVVGVGSGIGHDVVVHRRLLAKGLDVLLVIALLLTPLTVRAGDPYNFLAASEVAGQRFVDERCFADSGLLVVSMRKYNLFQLKQTSGVGYLSQVGGPGSVLAYETRCRRVYVTSWLANPL